MLRDNMYTLDAAEQNLDKDPTPINKNESAHLMSQINVGYRINVTFWCAIIFLDTFLTYFDVVIV